MNSKYNPKNKKSVFLADFFDYYRGKRLKKSDRLPGDIPLVTAGYENKGIATYISNPYDVYDNAITIDMFGNCFWRPYKFACDDNIIVLKSDILDNYTAHYFLSAVKKYIGDFHYNNQYRLGDLKKHIMDIPIINNEIDLEIIKSMSEVLSSISKLEAELEAELEARTKQHNHYFNRLVCDDFEDPKISKEKISSILVSMRTGLNPRKNFKLNTFDAENYYVTIKEMDGKNITFLDKTDKVNDEALKLINKRSNLDANDVLFSGTGTIGVTYLVTKKPLNWDVKEGIYILKPKIKIISPSYLRYILISEPFKQLYLSKISGSSVNSLPMKELKNISIPVPTMSEQLKRVEIFEKFENLVFDIKNGLPAEIEARRKQYEYYRNKLLTF